VKLIKKDHKTILEEIHEDLDRGVGFHELMQVVWELEQTGDEALGKTAHFAEMFKNIDDTEHRRLLAKLKTVDDIACYAQYREGYEQYLLTSIIKRMEARAQQTWEPLSYDLALWVFQNDQHNLETEEDANCRHWAVIRGEPCLEP